MPQMPSSEYVTYKLDILNASLHDSIVRDTRN